MNFDFSILVQGTCGGDRFQWFDIFSEMAEARPTASMKTRKSYTRAQKLKVVSFYKKQQRQRTYIRHASTLEECAPVDQR